MTQENKPTKEEDLDICCSVYLSSYTECLFKKNGGEEINFGEKNYQFLLQQTRPKYTYSAILWFVKMNRQ